MRSLLIDDKGEIQSASSFALRQSLDASIGGLEFRDFVVRNLGYIAITEMSGSIRLQLRPRVVSAVAFGAAMYWLADCKTDRIVVSRHDDSVWHDEIFGDRDSALSRVIDLVASGQNQRKKDFLRRRQCLKSLVPASPLRALLDRWSELTRTYDRERLAPVLTSAAQDRFLVVEGEPCQATMLIRDVGRGYPIVDNRWLVRAVGSRVQDLPDYDYGRWVADAYRDALEVNEPFLEEMDAIVDTTRHGRTRLRYRRIILPFDLDDGRVALLGSSELDHSIDLRVEVRKKA